VSRGYDFDEREDRPEVPGADPVPTKDHALSREPAERPSTTGSAGARTATRAEIRRLEHWFSRSASARDTLTEIGRFRTIATDDLLKHRYAGKVSAMAKDIQALQRRGLLERRSICVGKNRDTLVVVALTKEGARLARLNERLPEAQAVYAGFVKPAEVPHDAGIYQMYQAEAAEISAKDGKIRRVVLDYELKRNVYSKLAPARDSGALEYVRRQKEIADQHGLPVVDGRIALPDLRIEYETADGYAARADLELVTEHYHRGHMGVKARAGFKMYGFVSTSRGRRAQWEGRELSSTVLSL